MSAEGGAREAGGVEDVSFWGLLVTKPIDYLPLAFRPPLRIPVRSACSRSLTIFVPSIVKKRDGYLPQQLPSSDNLHTDFPPTARTANSVPSSPRRSARTTLPSSPPPPPLPSPLTRPTRPSPKKPSNTSRPSTASDPPPRPCCSPSAIRRTSRSSKTSYMRGSWGRRS